MQYPGHGASIPQTRHPSEPRYLTHRPSMVQCHSARWHTLLLNRPSQRKGRSPCLFTASGPLSTQAPALSGASTNRWDMPSWLACRPSRFYCISSAVLCLALCSWRRPLIPGDP